MTTKNPGEIAELKALIATGQLPKEALKEYYDGEDAAVHGFDAKRDRKGKRMQQGIGSPGHETTNHFNGILKYEGREAYERALADIWKRDPKRAEALGLPKFKQKADA